LITSATVLNSPRAVQMTVFVVRAFVKMREGVVSSEGSHPNSALTVGNL
jgi:hypothetical protein